MPAPTKKHAAKSKFFRIATEGATCDGRTIEKDWLVQMAKNYNPDTYGARINLEHYRGIVPDGPFKAYGDVTALKTETVDGKLVLLAQINPTDDLVALTKARQKIYTSCEIQPKFADTGEAYLVGLAVTDNPASLGTEMLQFSATTPNSPLAKRKQHPDNLFSVADEAVIEFEADADDTPSLFERIRSMFAAQKTQQTGDLNDITQAVEAIATEVTALAKTTAATAKASEQIAALTTRLTAIEAALDKTPTTTARPPATGANHVVDVDY